MERNTIVKKKNQIIWGVIILVFIGTTAIVQRALSNAIYIPLVAIEATLTPTITPSMTPSPTPTKTPDYDVIIFEIVNSDTTDPLNEYVSLYNEGSSVTYLTGWYIQEEGEKRYNFPINFNIPGKGIVRLWTKAGVNTIYDLYWGSEVEVWNDFSECAYLRDNSEGEKILVHKFCYSKDDGAYFGLGATPSP